MSEGIWNVIIVDSRDLMSPEPDIVDLNGVFGAKYGGTYWAPVGFAWRTKTRNPERRPKPNDSEV